MKSKMWTADVAGVGIGAAYSLRTRHSRPLWVMAAAGLNVGLLGGLFVGTLYLSLLDI